MIFIYEFSTKKKLHMLVDGVNKNQASNNRNRERKMNLYSSDILALFGNHVNMQEKVFELFITRIFAHITRSSILPYVPV